MTASQKVNASSVLFCMLDNASLVLRVIPVRLLLAWLHHAGLYGLMLSYIMLENHLRPRCVYVNATLHHAAECMLALDRRTWEDVVSGLTFSRHMAGMCHVTTPLTAWANELRLL